MEIRAILRLLRVKHYIKNCLIFLPLIFSGKLIDIDLVNIALIGFFSFCLISSSIYIYNDIKDVESDRHHPTKKERPIASGAVTIHKAIIIALICLLLSIVLCCMFCDLYGLVCIIIYIIINISYSNLLKNIPILDVSMLVSGFFLRVLFGSLITGIEISTWLFLTIIAVSFYLGLGKRRNELRDINMSLDNEATRKVYSFYNYAFLDKNMYVCMALANVYYALWAASHSSSGMIWTVPLVIIISMKYSLVIEGESEGDPVEVITHDKFLIILFCLYICSVYLMMYVIK